MRSTARAARNHALSGCFRSGMRRPSHRIRGLQFFSMLYLSVSGLVIHRLRMPVRRELLTARAGLLPAPSSCLSVSGLLSLPWLLILRHPWARLLPIASRWHPDHGSCLAVCALQRLNPCCVGLKVAHALSFLSGLVIRAARHELLIAGHAPI